MSIADRPVIPLTVDPYTAMAAAEFKVPVADVSKDQRFEAKSAFFKRWFENNRNETICIRKVRAAQAMCTFLYVAGIWPSQSETPVFGVGTTVASALQELGQKLQSSGVLVGRHPEDDAMGVVYDTLEHALAYTY